LPAILAGLSAVAAACASSGAHHASGTSGQLIRTDNWSPPALAGAPSAATFCALVTAVYEHEAELPRAATTKVKEQIVGDYISAVPQMVAAAPPDIAPAARTYFEGIARILRDLTRAGLDYRKLPAGTLGPLLLDPAMKAAGNQVIAYSQTTCHYNLETP
jgi:hypothetical protein